MVDHGAADRRTIDEDLTDLFFRGLFIMCVVGEGEVNGPPELVAECLRRRELARVTLNQVAADMPADVALRHGQHLADGEFGRAFAALVQAAGEHGASDGQWEALATVAETLCLFELLGPDPLGAEDPDYAHAAHVVRVRTGR